MKFIIVGAGRMGSGVAHILHLKGHTVTLIDRDPAAFERLGPIFKGKTIRGIGFDQKALLEAGVEKADGLAALTPSDDVNVVTARVAREVFRVPEVVARLYDPRKAEIYQRLGLQVVAPVTWSVNRIADFLLYSQLDPVFNVENGEANIVKAELPPLLVGRTAKELLLPGEVNIIAITRNGKTFLPLASTIFEAGDILHLIVMASASTKLESLLALK